MKAVYFTQTGSPDVLQYGDLPVPKPGVGQALIRVRAVSLNPIDTYIRNGANYWLLPNPFIPGCDFAGEIVELGGEALPSGAPIPGHLVVGQRVWGSNQGLLGRQGPLRSLRSSITPTFILCPISSTMKRRPPALWSASPLTLASFDLASYKRERRSSFGEVPVESVQWYCRWPKQSVPSSSPPRVRRPRPSDANSSVLTW